MSSFFQRARDRAQEAAAQLSSGANSHPQLASSDGQHQQQQYRQRPESFEGSTIGSSPASPPSHSSSGMTASSSSSGFTYKGGLPHVFRAGLASVDPRFESTRSLHVLRGSLKGIIIDELALSRETKTAAAKVFKWGTDHKIDGSRLDRAGDDALCDVSDRLAFILSTIADLEHEHADRLSKGRSFLKEIQTAELELASKRAQRVKITKELQGLVAERVVAGGHSKADQLSAHLDQLQQEAKSEEEALSKLKRQKLQACFDAQFDSYIVHGEKMALVASYGKLLMQQVPIEEAASFPASLHGDGQWRGSAATAQIRSLILPALKDHQVQITIPTLPHELETQVRQSGAVDGAYHPRDTASFMSFETTHADELAHDKEAYSSSESEKSQPASQRSSFTPLPSHSELATSAEAPALPPRHASGSTTTLSSRNQSAPLPSSVPVTSSPAPRLPSVSSGLHAHAQLPQLPSRGGIGSIHRVPPRLPASSSTATNYWDPSFLHSRASGQGDSQIAPYAVVLLNQAIGDHQKELFRSIWVGAQVRICADGGGNQILSTFKADLGLTLPLPDAVVGDFDSLSPSSVSFFETRNVHLAHRPSQYATDLGKSIQWLEDWETSHEQQLELVIFGGLSGRMDQTAHTLHVLWKLCPVLHSVGGYEDPGVDSTSAEGARGGNLAKRSKTWVVGEESLVYLVPAGVHKLRHPRPALGIACGVLPFGVEASGEDVGARVKTQGLEWDLDTSQPQSLGGFLSTSNHVVGHGSVEVTLESDKPIYWSIELGSAVPSAPQPTDQGPNILASSAFKGQNSSIPDPFLDAPRAPPTSTMALSSQTTQQHPPSSRAGFAGSDDREERQEIVDSAPPGPTVAETGQVIPSSPTGPGPLSGSLQPRRRSSVNIGRRPSAAVPAAQYPTSTSAGVGGLEDGSRPISPGLLPRPQRLPSDYSEASQGQGPVGNSTPAFLPPPRVAAAATGAQVDRSPSLISRPSEEFWRSNVSQGVSASGVPGGFSDPPGLPLDTVGGASTDGPIRRGDPSPGTDPTTPTATMSGGGAESIGRPGARIRRDGTITRRGIDEDFDEAEREQLPPYSELAGM